MTTHRFDPVTDFCIGCGAALRDLRNDGAKLCANDLPRRNWLLFTPRGEVVSVQTPVIVNR